MTTSPPRPAPTASPARLTARETGKLPRWVLLGLCLLYIVPGMIGRDPWKSEDASAFGVMWTMTTGGGFGGVTDWLVPNIVGAPVVESGPLFYWVGAGLIEVLGRPLGADLAGRLASIGFFFVTVASIWYATYLVNRRRPAQPATLAFGGHPDPKDYGRVLADGALLVLLATVGLLIRAHETSSDDAMLAMLALSLYGMARSLDEPRAGAGWIAGALVGLFLTRGPAPALALAVLWAAILVFHRDFVGARRAGWTILLPSAVVGIAAWPLAVWLAVPDGAAHLAARAAEWRRAFDGIDAQAAGKYLRTLPWSTWLAWPLAAWGTWTWRGRLREPHLAIPGGFVLAMAAVMASTSDTADGLLLLVLPGLVMLAAAGLPTLRRGGANLIDWFSLAIYSIAASFIWFTWFTKTTGIPAGFARSLVRLTPGATYTFAPLAFAFALLVTAAWVAVVRWRIVARPKVLWRSVVLASGGQILAWTLTSTLFIGTIDYSRTYRPVAHALTDALVTARDAADRAATTARTRGRRPSTTAADADAARIAAPGGSCVATDGVGLAQRASFAWFGGVRFSIVGYDGSNVDECDYLLRQDTTRTRRADDLPPGRWRLLWEGHRASDRDERFRLYRKSAGSTRGAGDAIDRNDVRDASPLNPLPTPLPVPPAAPPSSTPPSSSTGPAEPAPGIR